MLFNPNPCPFLFTVSCLSLQRKGFFRQELITVITINGVFSRLLVLISIKESGIMPAAVIALSSKLQNREVRSLSAIKYAGFHSVHSAFYHIGLNLILFEAIIVFL